MDLTQYLLAWQARRKVFLLVLASIIVASAIVALILNAFAKAYLDTALELRTEPTREAADWFEEQLKGMRTQVTQAQAKVTGFQKEKGIVGADDRMDIEYTRLAEISTQLSAQKN